MKLLVDMNLSPRWIGVLCDAGIEAMHWLMLGTNSAPDSEIMAYANAHGYVVLTHDLDFGARQNLVKKNISGSASAQKKLCRAIRE